MQRSRLSRDFSGRVEIGYQRRGDAFRRSVWTVSLLASAAAVAWLVWNARWGSPEIYHAGQLSTPHRMFSGRCEVCHEPFEGPLERLLAFTSDAPHSKARNLKCQECHSGAGHYFNAAVGETWSQRATAAHLVEESQACGSCHREHAGAEDLQNIASQSCVGCHQNLIALSAERSELASISVQNSGNAAITDFESHPEFAIRQLLADDQHEDSIARSHPARELLENFLRPGDSKARWQDRSKLRFSHNTHLNLPESSLPKALQGQWQHDCSSCHELDAQRQYYQPVNYERHCSSCHPLVFDPFLTQTDNGSIREFSAADPDAVTPAVVPHQSPQQVRAFLLSVYLRQLTAAGQTADVSGPLARPGRNLPGIDTPASPPPLDPTLASAAAAQTARAEQLVKSSQFSSTTADDAAGYFQSLQWLRKSGGCGYCHQIADAPETGDSAAITIEDLRKPPTWSITPPQIPDRWLVHSVFSHDAHRMTGCRECHQLPAPGSGTENLKQGPGASVGDVLLPGIGTCRRCHSTQLEGSTAGTGAGTQCVECHIYHQRQFEKSNPRSVDQILNLVTETPSE